MFTKMIPINISFEFSYPKANSFFHSKSHEENESKKSTIKTHLTTKSDRFCT